MLVAKVETGGVFSAGAATVLFEGKYESDRVQDYGTPNFGVSPDGQQFVMVRSIDEGQREPGQIKLVLNWFEELERLVPAH